MITLTELKTVEVSFFWARLASLGQLGLIGDPDLIFHKPWKGLGVHRRPQNLQPH